MPGIRHSYYLPVIKSSKYNYYLYIYIYNMGSTHKILILFSYSCSKAWNFNNGETDVEASLVQKSFLVEEGREIVSWQKSRDHTPPNAVLSHLISRSDFTRPYRTWKWKTFSKFIICSFIYKPQYWPWWNYIF